MRLIEGKLTQFIVDFPLCESESLANSEVA